MDRDNTAWLRGIVDDGGWPTVSTVGADGSHAAWLLVQHADADPAFQRRCLDLMTDAPDGEVRKSDVAYLTDRVRLAAGERQVYGTQVHLHDGRWEARDLDDPDNVDARRFAVNLGPLADYLAGFEKG